MKSAGKMTESWVVNASEHEQESRFVLKNKNRKRWHENKAKQCLSTEKSLYEVEKHIK